ncbi:MAG: class I SAM-dependent methyltransferase [Bdellovibrionota bacterium]
MTHSEAAKVSSQNKKFWDEPCGQNLMNQLGLKEGSPDALFEFDKNYFKIYPYLLKQIPVAQMKGKKVLEIGLGYGTLSQAIMKNCAEYTGLDIADSPVRIVNDRIRLTGSNGKVFVGSILEAPFSDASFDVIVSVGCLHHTGDLKKSIEEVARVLKPGGKFFGMVYNQFSFRQWSRWPRETFSVFLSESGIVSTWKWAQPTTEVQRAAYDASSAGQPAPFTEFSSKKKLREIFKDFSNLKMTAENMDGLSVRGRGIIPRRMLINSPISRIGGLDIYIQAVK